MCLLMKKFNKILIAIVMVIGLSLLCLLNFKAEVIVEEVSVEPGAGTLKKALDKLMPKNLKQVLLKNIY